MIPIKIKDPLFTYYARSVNILDFNPEKFESMKVLKKYMLLTMS